MSFIFILVLLPSALSIICSDTDVVILNRSGTAKQIVSECGRSLTLTCNFKQNTFAILWKNAIDVSPIAKCIRNYCAINPIYDGQYNISFDKTRCIFKLTVIKVTMKDNGRKLVCSDGSHSDFKIITVRDYNLDLIEDRSSGTVTATSGCVSKDTDVSFKWMKIDACSSIENQLAPKVVFKNTRSCSNDSVSWNEQLIQHIEEISSSPREDGKYLKVIAVYGNESKVSDEIVVKHMILKDADVTILNTSGIANQTFSECGRSLTLTCKFKKKTFAIVWKNAIHSFPIAKCIKNSCAINPIYDGQYNISFDKSRCMFNLTVTKVTMKDNGRKLVCSDGTHSDFKIITVRDYSLNLFWDRNSGTIIATSGCVSRDTDVSFKWMKIDACTSFEKQLAPKLCFKNITSCSTDYECGNNQLIQYIEEVEPSASGNYHLKVIAVYGNESKASKETVVRYINLKGEKHACDLQDKRSTGYIIYIAAASGFGMILQLLFIMKRAKLVSYIPRIMSGKMTEPSTNQRDNANDKVFYLAIPTAEEAAKEIKEEEETQNKPYMFIDCDT